MEEVLSSSPNFQPKHKNMTEPTNLVLHVGINEDSIIRVLNYVANFITIS